MNNIQKCGSINVNSNYGKVNKCPNFKAYDIKLIQEGLKVGKMPADTVIKEMEADAKKLIKSHNIDTLLSGFKLSNLLREIGKLGLQRNKKELEFSISLKKCLLVTANAEKKMELEQAIKRCENKIKEIDKILEN